MIYHHYRDVRIDTGLNRHVWSRGIKNLPKRVRVSISRKRNEDEDAKEKVRFSYFNNMNVVLIF